MAMLYVNFNGKFATTGERCDNGVTNK